MANSPDYTSVPLTVDSSTNIDPTEWNLRIGNLDERLYAGETKLATIETGATADMSAADIVTALSGYAGGSGTIADAAIPSAIARDSEVTAAVSAHSSLTNNPHSVTKAQVLAAEGIVDADIDSKLSASVIDDLPQSQITDLVTDLAGKAPTTHYHDHAGGAAASQAAVTASLDDDDHKNYLYCGPLIPRPAGVVYDRMQRDLDMDDHDVKNVDNLRFSDGTSMNSAVAATNFLGLTDTPNSYAGAAGLVPTVNPTETGLDFYSIATTFSQLTDTFTINMSHASQTLRVNAAGNAIESYTPTVFPTDFLGLSDTPNAYTASAGQVVRVNATPNALEFHTPALTDCSDFPSYSGNANKALVVNGAANGVTVSDLSTMYLTKAIGEHVLVTGLISGGAMSAATLAPTTKFKVASGIGIVVDNHTNPNTPSYTVVSIAATDEIVITNRTTKQLTYVGVTSAGAVSQQDTMFTPTQLRDIIYLGIINHENLSTIDHFHNNPRLAFNSTMSLNDFLDIVGPVKTGLALKANGANLKLNHDSGTFWMLGENRANSDKSPDLRSISAGTAISFKYIYRAAAANTWTLGSPTDTLVPGSYDDGDGTLGTVGAAQFTIQRVWLHPDPSDIDYYVEYGQNLYANLNEAVQAINSGVHVPSGLLYNSVLLGYVIMRGNATSLQSTSTTQIVRTDKFSNSGASGGGAGGSGASTFITLSDAPASYSAQKYCVPTVNSGETALEFRSSRLYTDRVYFSDPQNWFGETSIKSVTASPPLYARHAMCIIGNYGYRIRHVDSSNRVVEKFDLETLEAIVSSSIQAWALATNGTQLFCCEHYLGTPHVSELNTSTLATVYTNTSYAIRDIVCAGGYVWGIGNNASTTLYRYVCSNVSTAPTAYNHASKTLDGYKGLVYDGRGVLWIACANGANYDVAPFLLTTMAFGTDVTVGKDIYNLIADEYGYVYFADDTDNKVWRIKCSDSSTSSISISEIDPESVIIVGNRMYAAEFNGTDIVLIDRNSFTKVGKCNFTTTTGALFNYGPKYIMCSAGSAGASTTYFINGRGGLD